jgi:5'-3' exoribonuclease 1
LSHQVFELGDRIISCVDEGSVPVAAKGTVIGIHGLYLEILFDKMFMGGNDLGGRCSAYRGSIVPKNTVINLSKPQPPLQQRRTSPVRTDFKKSIQSSTRNFTDPAINGSNFHSKSGKAPESAWQERQTTPKNKTSPKSTKAIKKKE